jgi:hypothetical protein
MTNFHFLNWSQYNPRISLNLLKQLINSIKNVKTLTHFQAYTTSKNQVLKQRNELYTSIGSIQNAMLHNAGGAARRYWIQSIDLDYRFEGNDLLNNLIIRWNRATVTNTYPARGWFARVTERWIDLFANSCMFFSRLWSHQVMVHAWAPQCNNREHC